MSVTAVTSVTTAGPLPTDPAESARCQHTRLRRRMLYGAWRDDLATLIIARVGRGRAAAWGIPDMSANPFRALCQQVAVLYDRPPQISHPADPQGTASMVLAAELERAGAWSLLARVQRDTVGLREMLVRVDVDEDDGRLLLRPVPPDLVEARPDVDCPDEIGSLREARLRRGESGLAIWTWDEIDPAAETYRVVTEAGQEITTQVLGRSASGESYLYRDADGEALLPYALYHAARTGVLWDPYEGRELVEGTLQVGLLWTFWGHCVQDASWPQRYVAGWGPATANTEGDPGAPRTVVEVDPSILLQLVPLTDVAGQGLIGQWQPGAEPDKLAESITAYERRLAAYAGLSPSDFARVSGDPRSGYALAISREGQREAARRLEPQFRRGDEGLLRLCSAALNRWSERHGAPLGLPEDGWRIRYESLPPSPDEQRAQREQVLGLIQAGLMSRPQAYMELHPGVSLQEATAALAAVGAPAPAQGGSDG